jgi:hypothetical protein
VAETAMIVTGAMRQSSGLEFIATTHRLRADAILYLCESIFWRD